MAAMGNRNLKFKAAALLRPAVLQMPTSYSSPLVPSVANELTTTVLCGPLFSSGNPIMREGFLTRTRLLPSQAVASPIAPYVSPLVPAE